MSLDNIFGTKTPNKNSATKSSSLDNIFTATPTPKQNAVDANIDVSKAQNEIKTSPSLFEKATSVVGKTVTGIADWFTKQQQKSDIGSFEMKELLHGKTTVVRDPVTGKSTLSSPRLDAFKTAKTDEEKLKIVGEAQQEAPLIKFLNSEAGKKVTGTVQKATSNVPLKVWAGIKAIGDDTYDEAYSALLAKSKDPNNPRWEKILYGLQDSGVQSAIGALLAVGTTYLTKSPQAGQAVSLAYFAPISAEGQRQEKGKVTSIGDIAIDTVGDTIISGFAESALKSVIKEGGEVTVKEFAKQLGKGFFVEGTTEPAQTFLKYANDYKNAKSEDEKKKIISDVTNYVKSGGMVDEFLIGGLSGAGITGAAAGAGKVLGGDINVDPSLQINEEETPKKTEGSFNTDFSAVRDETQELEKELQADPQNTEIAERLGIAQDQLNDYFNTVKERPVYISSETQENPLATIEVVKFPDGKFTYSFSADTESNSFQSPFSVNETFATKEAAVEAGKKQVLEWVDQQMSKAEGNEIAKLQEIRQEIGAATEAKQKIEISNVSPETQKYYHGTAENAPAIKDEKFRIRDEKNAPFNSAGLSLTRDVNVAKNYGKKIIEISIKPDAKIISLQEAIKGMGKKFDTLDKTEDAAINWAKKNGFDAVDLQNAQSNLYKDVDELRVFNKEIIQSENTERRSELSIRERLLRADNAKIQAQIEAIEKSDLPTNIANDIIESQYTDGLTGLFNKDYYLVSGLVDKPQVSMDLRGLKQLNEEKGYKAADNVIAKVGELIKKYFPDRGIRWGGDEFVIDTVGMDIKDLQNTGNKFLDELKKTEFETTGDGKLPAGQKFSGVETVVGWGKNSLDAGKAQLEAKTMAKTEKVNNGFDNINVKEYNKLNEKSITGTKENGGETKKRSKDGDRGGDRKTTSGEKTVSNKSSKSSTEEVEKAPKRKVLPSTKKASETITDQQSKRLRNQAFKEILQENKVKYGEYITSKKIRADLKEKIKTRYNSLIENAKKGTAPVIKNTTQNQVENKPVKTKGDVKASKAFRRIQERLGEYADFDVNYNKLNLAQDTANALEFIEKNPKDAKKIALGLIGAPEGVTETAISIALAEKAADEKNYQLQAQLERSRSLRQTRRGQEIVAERGRFNENSAHFFIQQVLASRFENAGKQKFRFFDKKGGNRVDVEIKINEGTENIKETVKKKLSATELAQSVIDSLTC